MNQPLQLVSGAQPQSQPRFFDATATRRNLEQQMAAANEQRLKAAGKYEFLAELESNGLMIVDAATYESLVAKAGAFEESQADKPEAETR